MLGDVFGGVDEPAEDYGVIALEEQLGDRLAEQLELGVALAFELAGAGREAAQPPAVRRLAIGGVAVRARGGVGRLDGLLIGQVEDGRAAEPIGFGLVLGVEVGGPRAQGGGRRPRRGGQRAQKSQRGPVPDALAQLAAFGVADGFAGVLEHVVEQLFVRPGEGVAPLLGQPVFGKRGGLIDVDTDVAAAALDEVAGEQFPALDRFQIHVFEVWLEQGQQVAELLVLAAMRGRGDQDQVPLAVLGQALDQLVPQHPRSSAAAIGDAGVGLVDDQQVRASVPELLAQAGALDEVGRDDDVRVPVEKGLALEQAAFELADGAGQDEFGVDAELAGQFALPLFGERGTAEDGQAGGVALLQQFGSDQASFHGLADAYVVGDKESDRLLPQGHQERHQLVGAGFYGEPGQGAERAGAGAETDPECCPEEAGAYCGACVGGVGGLEDGGADLFQGGEHAGDLVVASAERA